jgi:PAS domain S-box-containing protein
VRIVLADDNPDDRALIARELRRELDAVDLVEAYDREGFERILAGEPAGAVVTDFNLHWADGLEILRTVKQVWPDCAVIMCTGTGSEEISAEAMKEGLDDYVLKHHMRRLPGAVRAAIERRGERAAARELEERYRRWWQEVPIGLFRVAAGGGLIDANPALLRTLGFADLESARAAGVASRYLDPADYERWRRLAAEGSLEGLELEIQRADGAPIWVRMTGRAVHDARDEPLYYEGTIEDVTERKRAEQELVAAKEFSDALVTAANVMVVALDVEGRIVVFNPEGERLTGWKYEELRGRSWFETLCPRDRFPEVEEGFRAWRAALRPLTELAESAILTRDGREIVVSWRNAELREHGVLIGSLSFGIDVSERMALEEQLRQAQKMEAVGRLAGGIAHDFNNLLTAIGGYSELLLAQLADERARRDVDEIRRAADRAAALTRQLLAFSRKQMVRPEVLSLNDVVADLEKMLRRLIGEDIELVTALAPGLGLVRADAGQLQQVILNLVVNARDAMPAGGTLTIETRNVDSHVALVVRDTGSGIDEEVRPYLFEPFFTTKEPGKGTGLGLATVYAIVEQAGGRIAVESNPGQGAAFEVTLPRFVGEPAAGELAEPEPHVLTGTETVLVVEDYEVVADLIRAVLAESGYTILEARDGGEALELAGGHPGPIHLLLTDVVLPRLSGPELAERLLELRPGLRVLFMSGYLDEGAETARGVPTPSAFVSKPFTPRELAEKVRAVLDAPGPAGGAVAQAG